MNKTLTIIKSVFILSLFSLATFTLAQNTWTPPSQGPTGGNVAPPIHTGGSQSKSGLLNLNGGLGVKGYAGFASNMVINPDAQYPSVSLAVNAPDALGNKFRVVGASLLQGPLTIANDSQGNHKILTSNADGLATWKTLNQACADAGPDCTLGSGEGGNNNNGNLPAGTSGQTLRHDGANWTANSFLFNNGVSVGIGTATPAANAKLEVAGQVKITGGNPGNNKILASDGAGLASWKTANELGLEGGGGGGGGTALGYSFNWPVVPCNQEVGPGSLNSITGVGRVFFVVPSYMNGWKLSNYHASVCEGSGSVTFIPKIKKANGTETNLTSITANGWNSPGAWSGSVTLNTGDQIRVQNAFAVAGDTASGFFVSFSLKP